jgi:hypothetical protein
MAKISPDPVTEGHAYQQQLLGLLGEDDPVEVQQVTEAELRSVLADASSDLPGGRPQPSGPSSSWWVISSTLKS